MGKGDGRRESWCWSTWLLSAFESEGSWLDGRARLGRTGGVLAGERTGARQGEAEGEGRRGPTAPRPPSSRTDSRRAQPTRLPDRSTPFPSQTGATWHRRSHCLILEKRYSFD